MDYVVISILGILAGILVGLLPGFGITLFLIISFPFLISQSLLSCIIFYSIVSSVSQYFGSVTALSFGIPGEVTSLPLLEIRKNIKNIQEAHFLCAYGSLIASVISGILLFLLIDIFTSITFYLKSYIILSLSLLGLFFCICYSSNKILHSIFFIISGWTLGRIGYSDIDNSTFLTFDNVYLYAGIPILPAIMGIYAIPNLINLIITRKKSLTDSTIYVEISKYKLAKLNFLPICRASTIGFFSGLIPYMGTGISSYMAFLLEKKIQPTNTLSLVTASEAANNAANLSVLIPLFALGIAIVPSEFVLLEIIYATNNSLSSLFVLKNLNFILFCILVANIVAFLLSWNLLFYVNKFMINANTQIYITIILLIFLGILIMGARYDQGLYYITILLVFFVIGIFLKNYDTLPFVYAFLLQNNIEQILYRVYKIYW